MKNKDKPRHPEMEKLDNYVVSQHPEDMGNLMVFADKMNDALHELDEKLEKTKKPEPLELWVNVYKVRDKFRPHSSERFAKQGAEGCWGSTVSPSIKRAAVHMREVVPVEPLAPCEWHLFGGSRKIKSAADGVKIQNSNNETLFLDQNAIPGLITALQGLMEGAK